MVQPGAQRHLEGGVDSLLGQPQGDGRAGGDLVAQPDGFLQIDLNRIDAADQAKAQRLVGRERTPVEHHLHRQRLTHGQRHALCAARAGNDAQVDLRLAELGRLAGHQQVAGHRQLAAAPQGKARHGGDDRLADAVQPIPQVNERADHHPRRSGVGHLLDVGPGGEGAGAAGDDHATHGRIGVERLQSGHQFGHQFAVKGVEGFGPVELGHAHAPLDAGHDVFVHSLSL